MAPGQGGCRAYGLAGGAGRRRCGPGEHADGGPFGPDGRPQARVRAAGGAHADRAADGDRPVVAAARPRSRPDPALHAIAQALLDRHGIVTRGSVIAERVPGGFGALYPVLRAMEEAGHCRRGYFVEGLGGAQFALPGAVDRMRAIARPGGSRGRPARRSGHPHWPGQPPPAGPPRAGDASRPTGADRPAGSAARPAGAARPEGCPRGRRVLSGPMREPLVARRPERRSRRRSGRAPRAAGAPGRERGRPTAGLRSGAGRGSGAGDGSRACAGRRAFRRGAGPGLRGAPELRRPDRR